MACYTLLHTLRCLAMPYYALLCLTTPCSTLLPGVRPDLARDPWHAYPAGCTRLVGQLLTATGMWLKQPRNRNFEAQGEEEAAEEEGDGGDGRDGDEGDALVGGDGDTDSDGGGGDDDDEDDGSKLRRAEFTLLGLDD